MKKIRLAIQKSGRLTEPSLDFISNNLRPLNRRFSIFRESQTKLQTSINERVELLYVRNSDIPKLLTAQAIDLGITGLNTLVESVYDGKIIKELDFAYCRLAIAKPKFSAIRTIADLQGKCLATSFPNSTKAFLEKNKLNAKIILLDGSVELAPSLGIADAIVDLVCSGKTLQDNNLEELATVYQSQAYLIGNQAIAAEIFSNTAIDTQSYLQSLGA